MACGSCGGSTWQAGGSTAKVGGKTLYAVITDGGAGRVAYQSHRLDLVRDVAARYPGSSIVPDPDAPALTKSDVDAAVQAASEAQDETAETPSRRVRVRPRTPPSE